MNSSFTDWRYRLRGDPGRWLLEYDDNPSVYFWFQRDIVGRPEDAPALQEAREQIVYSAAVQEIFSAQDVSGYWQSPTSLDLPRYRATLWSLALLAELGLPRTSRRARAACEFVLQNHLKSDGAFTGLCELDYAGLLVHALHYFIGRDSRLLPALDRLVGPAAGGNLFALWALVENRDEKHRAAVEDGASKILYGLERGDFATCGAFPSFDPADALLALRVLALAGRARDPRAAAVVEKIWARQQDGARWSLDHSYYETPVTRVEEAGAPSKWATIAALRVLTHL